MPIKGITKFNIKRFLLRANYEVVQEEVGHKRSSSIEKSDLRHPLSHCALKWRDIGTNLGFLSNELDINEGNPTLPQGAPKSWLRAMLEEWLEWAPGDKRGSKSYATLHSLKSALREANLGRIAEELTLSSCN